MADRVNTRFVVLLCLVLVGLTVGVAGFWHFFVNQDADTLVRRGDEFLAQGQSDRALLQYRKAIVRRPQQVPLRLKYVEVLEWSPVGDMRAARQAISQIIGHLSEVLTQEPEHAEAFEWLMRVYMKLGKDLNNFGAWQQMYDRALTKLATDDDLLSARKYRGIAEVHRAQRINIDPEDRRRALEDLTAVLEQQPGDTDTLDHLALWHVVEANDLERTGGDPDQVRHLRQEALLWAEKALETAPQDSGRQIDYLQFCRQVDNPLPQRVKQLAEQVLAQLASPSEPPPPAALIVRIADLLLTSTPEPDPSPPPSSPVVHNTPKEQGSSDTATSVWQRAEALIRAAQQRDPDNPRFHVALGRLLRVQQRHDEAIEELKPVLDGLVKADPFEAFYLWGLLAEAHLQYADLRLQQAADQQDPERSRALQEVQDLVDQVATQHGQSGIINLLQGKLAMMRGQWLAASEKLDLANTQLNESNPEVLILSARVWTRLGELGIAGDRYNRLLRLVPAYTQARHELTRVYLAMRDWAQAQKQVDRLLQADPMDGLAQQFRAQVLILRGETVEAARVYRSLRPEQQKQLAGPLTKAYVDAGDPQAARSLLLEQFEHNPSDLGLLYQLVSSGASLDQVKRHINTARKAGADPDALDRLAVMFEQDTDRVQMIDAMTNQQPDPVQRSLRRWQLYRRVGRDDLAEQALAHAVELAPNHPSVIESLFAKAMAEKDWDEAETLAGRAAAMNIDLAEGMFYFGRWQVGQGRYQQAISSYRRGLKLRPIYSDGWRQLGDAQRLSSDLDGATASYLRSLEQRPNQVAALQGLAEVYYAQRQYDQALETLRRAVRFSSGDRSLIARYLAYEQRHGNPQTALHVREQRAVSDPQDVSNRRALAVLLARLGHSQEAESQIQSVTNQFGQTRANVWTAATIHHITGDAQGARGVLQAYINSLEDRATVQDWLMLARFLLQTEQWDTAAAAYRQAMAIEDPLMRPATREWADRLFNLGRVDEAVGFYQRLWQADPGEKRLGLRYVEALVQAGQLESASQIHQQVVAKHGWGADTYFLDALVAQANGDTQRAIKQLNRAQDLAPQRAVLYFERAKLRAGLPGYESAVIDDLNRAIELDPDMDRSRLVLATIHIRRGEHHEAVRHLNTLLQHNPEHEQARLMLVELYKRTNQVEQARDLLRESVELFPGSGQWPWLLAQQAYLDGDTAEAIEKMRLAFDRTGSADMLAELVAVMIRSGQPDRALDLLRQQHAMTSPSAVFQALRARALMADGQDHATLNAFARAIDLCRHFNDLTDISTQLIQAYGQPGAVERVKDLVGGEHSAWVDLALVMLQNKDRRYDDAMDRLQRIGAQVQPGSPQQLSYERLLAVTLVNLGKHDQALEAYNRVLTRAPDDLMSLNNVAYLLAEDLGHAHQALPTAQRAAGLAPDNPLVLDTLGWTQFKAGQPDLAVATLQRSVTIRPMTSNCLHLAEVFQSRGDLSAAEQMATDAARLAEQTDDLRAQEQANRFLKTIRP